MATEIKISDYDASRVPQIMQARHNMGAKMPTFTKFRAHTHVSHEGGGGVSFPLEGKINDDSLAMLANNGTTPSARNRELLKAEITRIRQALESGKTVATKTATIEPLAG